MSAKAFEPDDSRVLTDLAQVKILADPLRVRVLELLSREELTTKQVAESLGEKPTKLYHHVEALERAELVRLVRTRPNRGTLEKYYRAVARSFTVDTDLFKSEAGAVEGSGLPEMVSSVLERTRDELGALFASGSAGEMEALGLLSFIEIEGSEERLRELRDGLAELIQRTAADAREPDEAEATRRYRLTLALFPLDRS